MTDEELKQHYTHLNNQIATRDAQQMAMKIAINSLYGASGNEGFRYYDPSIAEAITQSGQLAIRYIGRRISEFLDEQFKTSTGQDRWCYSDTDSVVICLDDFVQKITNNNESAFEKSKIVDAINHFCENKIEPFIADCYEELATYMNAYCNQMQMKREVIADAALFRAKKNYVMQVYDNEHVRYDEPKLKMMGIETAKSTTPDFVKEALIDCYKIMLNGNNQELLDKISSFHIKYLNEDYNNLATPRGVNSIMKWVDSDGSYKNRIPYHVKASLEFNRLLKEKGLTDIPPITDGMKVRIITLSNKAPVDGGYIAYVGSLPEEFGLTNYIDRETLFEKTFLSPVESFTSTLGWKHQDTFEINDFFV